LKKLLALSLVLMLFIVSACSNEQGSSNKPAGNETKTEQGSSNTGKNNASSKEEEKTTEPVTQTGNGANSQLPERFQQPVKIALVMQLTGGSFYTTQIKGVNEQVKAFGGDVKIYDSQNDLAKMAANIELAVNEKVDGILVSHGRADALTKSIQRALDANIPVVAFDSDLNMPGVTVLDQDDYLLAWRAMKKIAEDLRGKGNIATIWVAGYAPMEKRQVIIEAAYKRFPNLKEVSRFGNATANTALDTQAQVESLLTKYPKEGQIDAIFGTWNEFTRGALKALEQKGRTDIKVYGIDLTDEDLPLMQKEGSPLVAAAATDPAEVGRVQVRLLYQKIGGIDVSDIVAMEPVLVKKESLPAEPIKLDDLDKYVPGWGKTDIGKVAWMEELEKGAKQ